MGTKGPLTPEFLKTDLHKLPKLKNNKVGSSKSEAKYEHIYIHQHLIPADNYGNIALE